MRFKLSQTTFVAFSRFANWCRTKMIELLTTTRVPPPVVVSERDLSRVLVVVVVGTILACLLALRLDDIYAADQQDPAFHYPYVVDRCEFYVQPSHLNF